MTSTEIDNIEIKGKSVSQALLTVIDPHQIGYAINKNYLPTTRGLPF